MAAKCPNCGSETVAPALDGQCPVCLLRLALGADQPPPSAPAGPDRPPDGFDSRFFGDYELLCVLAHGGMGVIYRARQLNLNREVALKMIATGPHTSKNFVERFRVEAHAAAALNHANIVPIYETGEYRGRHFICMKLMAGGTLASRLGDFQVGPGSASAGATSGGPRAANRARAGRLADLMILVARATHHAHQRGILHRDLKPGNILLDEADQPHVADFGLAKLTEEESLLTQSGAIMGTPAYMAPEQAAGATGALTVAADIYSLGAILYHLLAGRPPFHGATPLDTMRQVVDEDPVPPHRVHPAVDADLAAICLKCLHKDPLLRYGSALALAEDLERWRKGDTIYARPATKSGHCLRWVRRNPVVAGLASLVLLLLLVVTGVSVGSNLRIQHALNDAVAARQDATDKLWWSYLHQAEAERWSGKAGRRFASLEAISNAAAIHPSLELRNAAIASLALADLKPASGAPTGEGGREHLLLDWPRHRYVDFRLPNSLTIRQLGTGRELVRLPSTASPVKYCRVLSADGRWLAVICEDKTAQVWNLATQKIQFEYPQTGDIAFSPDSTQVAVSLADTQLVVQTLNGAEPLRSYSFTNALGHVAWSPSGQSIAAIEYTNLFVFDAHNGNLLNQFGLPSFIFTLAWHPSGEQIALGCDDHNLYLVNLATGPEITKIAGHQGAVTSVAFNPDGSILASDSWDGTTRLWDFATGLEICRIPAGSETISFSPDGRQLAVYTDDSSKLFLFDVGVNEAMTELGKPLRYPNGEGLDTLLFGHHGAWLATRLDGGVAFWDPVSGKKLGWVPQPVLAGLAQLPDGRLFGWDSLHFLRFPALESSMSETGPSTIFSPGPSTSLPLPPEFLTGFTDYGPDRCSASRDGRVLAVTYLGHAYVFDMGNQSLRAVTARQPGMKYVAVSPDGGRLATGCWHAGNVKIWRTADGQLEREIPSDYSSAVAFSPDGQWLLVGTGQEFQFWRTSDWTRGRQFTRPEPDGVPGAMAFSPDSSLVALGHTRRLIQLISLKTGETLAQIEPFPEGEIVALAFSPDGAELALTRTDCASQIWHLRRIREQLAPLKLAW